MLKIKDNVDLKELEKYGFKNCETYCWLPSKNDIYIIELSVDLDTKVISHCGIFGDSELIISAIYNLTKDGLIEEINDKNDSKRNKRFN